MGVNTKKAIYGFQLALVFVLTLFVSYFFVHDSNKIHNTSAAIDPSVYSLSLSTNSNIIADLDPVAGKPLAITKDVVKGTTTSPSGYKLYISTESTSTDMSLSGGNSSSKKIKATSGTYSAPTSLNAGSTGVWGYAVAGLGSFDSAYNTTSPSSASKFAAIPAKDSEQLIHTHSGTANNDATEVFYGIKVSNSLPSGAYKATILYTSMTDVTSVVDGEATIAPISVVSGYSATTATITTSLSTHRTIGTATATIGNQACTNVLVTSNNPVTITCTIPENLPAGDYDLEINLPRLGKSYMKANAVKVIPTYTCTKRYHLQNADGTYPTTWTADGTETLAENETCSYQKSATDYQTKSGTATMTGDKTISLELPRNTYKLTVNKNNNYIDSVSGAGTYPWGQTINISATAKSDSNFTTWSQTAGTTSTIADTASTSTTFVMPKSATTVYADGTLKDPAAPTISGGATKIYGASDTTLTCTTTSTYNDAALYYSFGYATSDGGTPGNWSTASTTNTFTVGKTAYVGIRYYSCRVYASDGTTTTQTLTSATSADTQMTINNAKLTFDANDGTLSGSSTLYTKSGATGVYTGVRNSTAGTIPTASKTGHTLTGWYTAKTNGNKVLNADGTIAGAVSGYTSASAWTTTVNRTLYAQFSIDSHTLTVNPNGGTWNSSTSSQTFTENYGTTKTIADPSANAAYTISYNANSQSATYTASPKSATRNFTGWTKSGSGSFADSVYTFGDGDGTLTAQYASTSNSFTLPAISKTGYSCKWAEGSASGTKYDGGTSRTVTANTTYYASCTANSYTIGYTLNGGTNGTNKPTSGTYDADVQISNPTKTITVTGNVNNTGATIGAATSKAQTFAGWTSTTMGSNAKTGTAANPSTAWTGTSTKNTYFKNLRESGTVTMVANWTPVAVTLPTLSKTGYSCKWYTAATGGSEMGGSGASWTPGATSAAAVTAYARCTAIPCQFSAGQVVAQYAYSGNVESFTVPENCTGIYKLEVWGSQGSTNGGLGGYSQGTKALSTGTTIYTVVGGTNGYNGGAGGGGGTGGGATHMAKVSGVLSSTTISDLYLVAGGGGGGVSGGGGSASGGYGGGTSGGRGGTGGSDVGEPRCSEGGYGGTQTSGGASRTASCADESHTSGSGSYGRGGSGTSRFGSNGGGGGGGLYGGSGGAASGYVAHGGGGGGSGYVGDVDSGSTLAGNQTVPTQDGTSTRTGNAGNGYAKITFVEPETNIITYHFNGTTVIKQAIHGESVLDLYTPSVEGYEFVGWSESSSSTTVLTTKTANGTPITLYGVFRSLGSVIRNVTASASGNGTCYAYSVGGQLTSLGSINFGLYSGVQINGSGNSYVNFRGARWDCGFSAGGSSVTVMSPYTDWGDPATQYPATWNGSATLNFTETSGTGYISAFCHDDGGSNGEASMRITSIKLINRYSSGTVLVIP